jgi:flagellar protein FliO/FliZ
MNLRCAIAWLSLLPLPVLADSVTPAGGTAQLLRTALGLVLIIGMILALAWAARRVSGQRWAGRDTGPIRVVAQQALGVKERLLVVEVDGQRMLLGVTPGRISHLTGLGAAEIGEFDRHLESGNRPRGRS